MPQTVFCFEIRTPPKIIFCRCSGVIVRFFLGIGLLFAAQRAVGEGLTVIEGGVEGGAKVNGIAVVEHLVESVVVDGLDLRRVLQQAMVSRRFSLRRTRCSSDLVLSVIRILR